MSPFSTWKMPAGAPASANNSASSIGALGSFSEGFRMKALPQATAMAPIQHGIMIGKLNGVMPATTPTGWRIDQLSMSVATCSVKSPRM